MIVLLLTPPSPLVVVAANLSEKATAQIHPRSSRPRAQPSRPKTTNTAITADEQNNINEDFVVREIRREIIPMQNELIFLRSSLVQAHMTTMNMFNYIEQQVINFGQLTIQLNNNIEQIQQEMERMRISGTTQNSDISIIDPHFCAEVFGDNGNDELRQVDHKRDIIATSTVETLRTLSPNWANNSDDNGLYFAQSCHPSNNRAKKCFDAAHNKICYHNEKQVSLNQLGQYVIFPSRWWHRGYYNIKSEFEYYTAQLFCTGAQDSESWAGHTRAKNNKMKQGRLHTQDVLSVSQDIDENWDTTYADSKYPPSKAFDGVRIDPGTNRHLTHDSFRGIPEMNALVKTFESQNRELRVNSVWIIKKSKDNQGFQKWHRDFYLETGAGIINTIVVNVGVYKNENN